MRTPEDIRRAAVALADIHGEGSPKYNFYLDCYEACIPKSFWFVSAAEVTHNRLAFEKVVMKYCARRKRVQRNGWSLVFIGDNGVGKTMFISYVLTQMIRRGCSTYYTTLAQLDIDIKRGFRDTPADTELTRLLASDFVAVDEIGKEHFRAESYLNTRLELLMKQRYDDGDPMLLATNLDHERLIDMYGPSIGSMIEGKYKPVLMETGDFRKAISMKMKKDMG